MQIFIPLGPVGSEIVGSPALGFDNVICGDILLSMYFSFVVLVALIWYLSQVVPWANTNSVPFYFPILVRAISSSLLLLYCDK